MILKMHGRIYLIENKVNGKIYIGKTIQSLSKRWKVHTYYARKGSKTLLARAIKKYGVDSFRMIELAQCWNEEGLNAVEKICIAQFNSTNNLLGYNLTIGGDGISGWKHTDEAKAKISLTSKGHITSEEQKKKISTALQGRKYSEETIEKMRKAATLRCQKFSPETFKKRGIAIAKACEIRRSQNGH